MTDKPDGGPASPLQDWDPCIHAPRSHTGLSIRDWFAGMALPSVVAAMENNKHRDGLPVELVPDVVAETAYLFADAMLIARGK